MKVTVELTPDMIAAAVVHGSHGLGPFHVLTVAQNFEEFMTDIPQETIDALRPADLRRNVADALRAIAARFHP